MISFAKGIAAKLVSEPIFATSSLSITSISSLLAGLAIYNSHILEFQFPLVLYKKLMGQGLSLPDDLAELHPEIHASLGKLAGMKEDELASMGLTFQVTFCPCVTLLMGWRAVWPYIV
jgi:hypothetical protein